METQTETATVIPSASDVEMPSGGKSYRIANGFFVRGEQITETVQVMGQPKEVETGRYPEMIDTIVGIVRRVGIHEEDGKYGLQRRFDVDFETAEGHVYVSLSLLDTKKQLKISVSTLFLAWCVLNSPVGQPMGYKTSLGEPVTLENGSEGGRPTYVNLYRFVGKKGEQIRRPARDKNAPRTSIIDQWKEYEDQIRAHPLYAPRPNRRDDHDEEGNPMSHIAGLCDECAKKGWPTPRQAEESWLAIIAKAFRTDGADKFGLEDWDDDSWGQLRLAFRDRTEMPALLKTWLETQTPAAANAAPAALDLDI